MITLKEILFKYWIARFKTKYAVTLLCFTPVVKDR